MARHMQAGTAGPGGSSRMACHMQAGSPSCTGPSPWGTGWGMKTSSVLGPKLFLPAETKQEFDAPHKFLFTVRHLRSHTCN